MNISRTPSPISIGPSVTAPDRIGIFSVASMWRNGRTLWARRLSHLHEREVPLEDRAMLSSTRVSSGGPMILVNEGRSPASRYIVSWDRQDLVEVTRVHSPRRRESV